MTIHVDPERKLTKPFSASSRIVHLSPGSQRAVQFSFTPTAPGRYEALVDLRVNQGEEVLQLRLMGQATPSGGDLEVFVEDGSGALVPLVGCLQFPFTAIGSASEKSLVLENVGSSPVELDSLAISVPGNFSLASPELADPITLDPDQTLSLTVVYTPQTSEKHEADLLVDAAKTDDDLEVCLRGTSDGPALVCEPTHLDFGEVWVGLTETLTLRCTNASVTPPGGTPHLLFVSDISSDAASVFSPRIVGGISVGGYGPGDEFLVEVAFSPTGPGPFAGAIAIANDSVLAPLLEVSAAGSGVAPPPCDFSVEPPSLDFGLVPPGKTRSLTAYIVNHSSHACLVRDLGLAAGSDPAFSVQPIPHAILPPADGVSAGHRLPVRVTFSPAATGESVGEVTFTVSSTPAGPQSIAVAGSGGEGCLEVVAQYAEFAGGRPQCSPREIRVSVGNFCAEDVRIEEIALVPDDGRFELGDTFALPALLEEGDRREFSIAFSPDLLGAFQAAVRVEAVRLEDGVETAIGPFVVPVEGEATQADPVVTESWRQGSKVDVLFVMDNSPSVAGDYVIPELIHLFLRRAYQIGADFRVGVTTTGVAYAPINNPTCPGGFNGDEDGRLFPHPNEGRPRFVHAGMSEATAVETLRANLQVGWCHAFEAVYEAMRRAISSPWLHVPLQEGGNAGFWRPEAELAIVALHEEVDSDSYWKGDPNEDRSVSRYVDFLKNRKPSWRQDRVKIHMISGGLTKCSFAAACSRCVEGPQLTGGLHRDICDTMHDPSVWEDVLVDISEAVFALQNRFELRGRPADVNQDGSVENDIVIRVNGWTIEASGPTGARRWRFDAATNSVVFTGPHVPPAGAQVEIEYRAGCS